MSVLEAVLAVFLGVAEWIGDAMESLVPIFWTVSDGGAGTGSLTFFGVLAVASLAFSVVFLCLGLVGKFLRFGFH